MKLLLDSQAFILAAATMEGGLSPLAKRALLKSENSIYLSLVSVWEMQIKISLGKLHLPVPLQDAVRQSMSELGVEILAIEASHIYRLADMPFHHRDPFDRLLAAQALAEGMDIVSADRIFSRYGVHRIW